MPSIRAQLAPRPCPQPRPARCMQATTTAGADAAEDVGNAVDEASNDAVEAAARNIASAQGEDEFSAADIDIEGDLTCEASADDGPMPWTSPAPAPRPTDKTSPWRAPPTRSPAPASPSSKETSSAPPTASRSSQSTPSAADEADRLPLPSAVRGKRWRGQSSHCPPSLHPGTYAAASAFGPGTTRPRVRRATAIASGSPPEPFDALVPKLLWNVIGHRHARTARSRRAHRRLCPVAVDGPSGSGAIPLGRRHSRVAPHNRLGGTRRSSSAPRLGSKRGSCAIRSPYTRRPNPCRPARTYHSPVAVHIVVPPDVIWRAL